MEPWPEQIAVRPRGPLDATVRVPGSRSLTNRALLAAALADGESVLSGALESDDTEAMRDCLDALGVRIETAGDTFRVFGRGGHLAAPERTLDVRYSGTTARFVTAAATLAAGPSRIDGEPRMRERPIDDLVHALVELGAGVSIEGRGGCPPLSVTGGGLPGGSAVIDGSRSSQYVSGVLLAAPCAASDVTLKLKDGLLVSRPYVEMTLSVMRAFGAEAGWRGDDTLHVTARPYRARDYAVEPDASSAAYPFAAAAIAGGRVRVEGLAADSVQADVHFLDALEAMGCTVVREAGACEVRAPEGALRGVDLDANDFPDASMALAVVALFADGPSHIRNVGNLRIKETDRLSALETELGKLGATVRAGNDDLVIEPAATYHGAAVDTYEDHRMAMALALAGLRIPEVEVRKPECVRKTWPDYFGALERLS